MKLKRKNKYAVGQIVGAAFSTSNSIRKPLLESASRTNPNTGEFINYNKAQTTFSVDAIVNPIQNMFSTFSDPTASRKDKWMGVGNLLTAGTLGGLMGKSKAKRLEKAQKEQLWNQQNPNYYNSPENPYYMAQGGVAGEYAELEDGEPFMTPDGNIEMVNGNTHAQGGEDYILPEGTAILGKNESKVFGEKFKVLGEKLKRAQDKHQKLLDSNANPIARRSSMLMLDRIEKEYKALVNEQEMAKVGAAEKQFAKGGITKRKYPGGGTAYSNLRFNPEDYIIPPEEQYGYNFGAQNNVSVKRPFVNNKQIIRPELLQSMSSIGAQSIENVPFNTAREQSLPSSVTTPLHTPGRVGGNGNSFMNNAGSTLSTIGQLAPIIYNLGEGMFGKPEKYNYQQHMNPFIGDIRSAMRNRRYNVEPELEANRLAQSVFNRNIRQGGLSPSQLIGGTQAGAVSRMRADAGVRAQQQNMNNDYLAQQAQMDYNLGENISKLKNYGYEMNLKNRAAKKNYLSTGLTQLQQYAQVQELMRNQKISDKEKLNLLKDIIPNYFYTPGLGYEQKTK